MITRNTFETAARETLLMLEQAACERLQDFEDSHVYASLTDMFLNVDVSDDDMETLYEHEESAWFTVASLVHSMDPDWTPDFGTYTFSNEMAVLYEIARRDFYYNMRVHDEMEWREC